MVIENDKICGFESYDSLIKILDQNGRSFYYFENPKRERIVFNLPCGIFYSENKIVELKRPLKFVCPELPKPDKDIEIKEMEFFVQGNPHKCSIDVNRGIVIIDPEIANKEIPFFNFVLFHEVGHNFYNGGTGEHKCDMFAAKMMLERYGFNKSQVYFAQEFCLSEKSINRKDILHNFIQKTKVYE